MIEGHIVEQAAKIEEKRDSAFARRIAEDHVSKFNDLMEKNLNV